MAWIFFESSLDASSPIPHWFRYRRTINYCDGFSLIRTGTATLRVGFHLPPPGVAEGDIKKLTNCATGFFLDPLRGWGKRRILMTLRAKRTVFITFFALENIIVIQIYISIPTGV